MIFGICRNFRKRTQIMNFINKCLALVKRICDKTTFTSKIYAMCEKNAELIRYIFCGGLTTLFNLVLYLISYYLIFSKIISGESVVSIPFFSENSLCEMASNAVAWFFAVLFAFFVNKIFVFRDETSGRGTFLRILEFYFFRLVTGVIEIFLPSVITSLFALHEYHFVAKVGVSVIIILGNYFFTKFVTFSKKRKP